uniref:Protein kinase domain-containing protein n=1 Tax=Macrostomum lignano TaxID=282301 RepID=A0A1I8FN21_9PLAT
SEEVRKSWKRFLTAVLRDITTKKTLRSEIAELLDLTRRFRCLQTARQQRHAWCCLLRRRASPRCPTVRARCGAEWWIGADFGCASFRLRQQRRSRRRWLPLPKLKSRTDVPSACRRFLSRLQSRSVSAAATAAAWIYFKRRRPLRQTFKSPPPPQPIAQTSKAPPQPVPQTSKTPQSLQPSHKLQRHRHLCSRSHRLQRRRHHRSRPHKLQRHRHSAACATDFKGGRHRPSRSHTGFKGAATTTAGHHKLQKRGAQPVPPTSKAPPPPQPVPQTSKAPHQQWMPAICQALRCCCCYNRLLETPSRLQMQQQQHPPGAPPPPPTVPPAQARLFSRCRGPAHASPVASPSKPLVAVKKAQLRVRPSLPAAAKAAVRRPHRQLQQGVSLRKSSQKQQQQESTADEFDASQLPPPPPALLLRPVAADTSPQPPPAPPSPPPPKEVVEQAAALDDFADPSAPSSTARRTGASDAGAPEPGGAGAHGAAEAARLARDRQSFPACRDWKRSLLEQRQARQREELQPEAERPDGGGGGRAPGRHARLKRSILAEEEGPGLTPACLLDMAVDQDLPQQCAC